MIKQVKHTYKGMVRDLSKTKFPNSVYYDAKNISLFADKNQTLQAVRNSIGPKQIGFIPNIYIVDSNVKVIQYGSKYIYYNSEEISDLISSGINETYNNKVIGYATGQKGFVLFTTDSITKVDAIWHLEYFTNELDLIYLRKMNFDINRPIQAICNYENDKIEKVYWVDGDNQLSFLNIRASIANGDSENAIDIPVNNIRSVSSYELSTPYVDQILDGGTHTAGKVQYAYTLYRINGAETKLSPLSKLISLGNSIGGADVNEEVSQMPSIKIENLDTTFTNIRIYRFKYTTLNATPSIYLINDSALGGDTTLSYVDSGSIIEQVNPETVTFAGNDLYIPKNIAVKDNHLFVANYKDKDYRLDLDTRIYSFKSDNTCKVLNSIYLNGDNVQGEERNIYLYQYTDTVNDNFDSINGQPDVQLYEPLSGEYGARGTYFALKILSEDKVKGDQTLGLKDDEIYRFAIRFYNKYGQKTEPKWLADIKAPSRNLEDFNKINTVHFEVTNKFLTYIQTLDDDLKPIGYDILMAERNFKDRTVLSNGIVSTMMFQHIERVSSQDGTPYIDEEPILPSTIIRNIDTDPVNTHPDTRPAEVVQHLKTMVWGFNQGSEIQHAKKKDEHFASHWQYTKMMQMYSPETLFFGEGVLTENTRLKVKGLMRNTLSAAWLREVNLNDGVSQPEAKVYGGLSPHFAPKIVPISGSPGGLLDTGMFGHPSGSNSAGRSEMLFYRKYGIYHDTSEWDNRSNLPVYLSNEAYNKIYTIYGKPEYSELGHSYKSYNNDFRYRYANTLEPLMVDGDTSFDDDGEVDRKMLSYNVHGQRAITFMLNSSDVASSNPSTTTEDRLSYEDLYANVLNSQKGSTPQTVLYCELVKPHQEWLFSGIYGGNTYESKLRTFYKQFSTFISIDNTTPVVLNNCGDTYLQTFKLLRMVRGNEDIKNPSVGQYEEIVEFPTETTVDLTNRNDSSLFNWDNNEVYINSDYHKYNKVYSQQSNLYIDRPSEYTTKHVDTYDTSIIASKLKYPGELIDNWTDLLANETMALDGSYGPINSIVSLNDQLFTFQDTAVASLSINPNVQISSTNGSSLELGKGSLLHDYRYFTTTSGSINKWAIQPTEKGIYYFDALNKTINVVREGVQNISDMVGMKTYFNNIDYEGNLDNPLITKGISVGYSQDMNLVQFNFNLPNHKESIDFSTNDNLFLSRHEYVPLIYATKGDEELVISKGLSNLYKMRQGKRNYYFDQFKESSITILVSDNPDLTKVVNNINFKLEAYENGVELPFKSISKIRVYNEYQDSGYVDVVEGMRGNARKRFRDWNISLPRNAGTTERIRNPWNYIEIVFNNDPGKDIEIILHELIVSYTI